MVIRNYVHTVLPKCYATSAQFANAEAELDKPKLKSTKPYGHTVVVTTYQLFPLKTLELTEPDVELPLGLRPQHVRHQPAGPESRRQLLKTGNVSLKKSIEKCHRHPEENITRQSV